MLIFFPHLCLGLLSGLFPSGFPTKVLTSCVLHTLPISSPLLC
jgi:hypothetical protein